MLDKFLEFYLNLKINKEYSKNFFQNGKKPQSVFWNSNFNQIKRFEELLNFLPDIIFKNGCTIADVGCGYGALYEFMRLNEKYKKIKYIGVDINKHFIEVFKKTYNNKVEAYLGSKPKNKVDYCLMSGTYNLTKIKNVLLWEKYIYNNLKKCLSKSNKGIIFNLQFNVSAKIKNNIFYSNPNKIKSLFMSEDLKISYTRSKFFINDMIFVITKKY